MMPVLDGYGVLHLINKNEELKNIPFIFLTAKSERGDFRRGMEMGADDYITKPFTDIELLNSIESRLKKVELLKKQYPSDISGMHEFMFDLEKETH
jgi:DNA-binding response OmpR family regulator